MAVEQNGYKKGAAIGYWISTVLLAFILISGGLWLMVGNQPMDTYLGYPAYFWLIIGFCKVLGGIAILVPRFPVLKEWAYAGIIFNMAGASASRIFVNDSAAHIIVPLVICGITFMSWYLRPESRRMTSFQPNNKEFQLISKEQ